MIDTVTAVQFPQSWQLQREPARPPMLRIDYCGGMRFNDNFDWHNIWYDCVQLNESQTILIGPPIYDAKRWFADNAGFADRHGRALDYQFYDLDRVSYTLVHTKAMDDSLIMISKQADPVHIAVNHNDGFFNGHRVMVTLQKNNPLSWIRQWMHYHWCNHGVDAFLIYDNGSTKYTCQDMLYMLSSDRYKLKIVPWPYPYGPQGSDHAPWDSDFGQYCMLEHAKYRYLSHAGLVLNHDIDELLVSVGPTLDQIQQQLTTGPHHCVAYKGRWIEPHNPLTNLAACEVPMEERRFADYCCTDANNTRGIGHKWMLVPQHCMTYQWLVHRIAGPHGITEDLFYGHYLAMNTNWSWTRDQFQGKTADLKPNPWLHTALARMAR